MATAENIAIERRVDMLETDLDGHQLILVRTTFVVCERAGVLVRGKVCPEPDYLTKSEVLRAARYEPAVREVRRERDLELLIDPVDQVRVLRSALPVELQSEFDDLSSQPEVKLIEVEIRCHEGQLGPIRSSAPLVAAFGGNRAGKSMILVWRLFRRWMLRGGPPGEDGKPRMFWWVGPDKTKVIEEGVWSLAGPNGTGGGVWPDALFRGLSPINLNKQNPQLQMADGSIIGFKHANHSGKQAGKNLKSAKVVDAVVDEVGAILSESNFHQVEIRVSQTGGSVGCSTTRVTNHWSHERITKRAAEAGPELLDVSFFDLFDNPWMTYARIWQLFLVDGTLSTRQLENVVLPADDKREACLSVITNPKSLREHFGIETASGHLMWTEWRPSLVYSGNQARHDYIHVTGVDGKAVRLINITGDVLARNWPQQAAQGLRWDSWAATDPNKRGHAVVFELFGSGRTVPEAIANKRSWTVLVTDEVQVDGTTLKLAHKVREQAGRIPVYYDPHGAPGHAARGTSGELTDAQVWRNVGHHTTPPNGTNAAGKPRALNSELSRTVMHMLMKAGRLLVHERCTGVIDAFTRDQRKPDGRIDKRSSPDSESDFRTGYSDSARYGIWPIMRFVHEEPC